MCMQNLTTFLTLNLNNFLNKSSNVIKSPPFMHFVGNLMQFTKLECLNSKGDICLVICDQILENGSKSHIFISLYLLL